MKSFNRQTPSMRALFICLLVMLLTVHHVTWADSKNNGSSDYGYVIARNVAGNSIAANGTPAPLSTSVPVQVVKCEIGQPLNLSLPATFICPKQTDRPKSDRDSLLRDVTRLSLAAIQMKEDARNNNLPVLEQIQAAKDYLCSINAQVAAIQQFQDGVKAEIAALNVRVTANSTQRELIFQEIESLIAAIKILERITQRDFNEYPQHSKALATELQSIEFYKNRYALALQQNNDWKNNIEQQISTLLKHKNHEGTSNNPKFGCKSEQQRPIQIQMNAHWTEFAVFLWCIAPKSAVLADLGRQKAVILASFK